MADKTGVYSKGYKSILLGLLVAAGLYSASNAEIYVQSLDDSTAKEMVETLELKNLKPAIFVAAATDSARNRIQA